MKKAWAFAVVSVLALAGLSVIAGENLLPAGFVQELCRKPNTGVGYLKAEGAMPEGITVTTDRAHDPIYRVETSGVVPCAVKKGDLVVLTAAGNKLPLVVVGTVQHAILHLSIDQTIRDR